MSKAPPLGLKPKYIHDNQRLQEIFDAMNRYRTAKQPVPKEWVAEFESLVTGRSQGETVADEALQKAYDLLGKVFEEEKQLRIKYQEIVYNLCSIVDREDGHFYTWTGCTTDTVLNKLKAHLRALHKEINDSHDVYDTAMRGLMTICDAVGGITMSYMSDVNTVCDSLVREIKAKLCQSDN